jgi:phage gp29-like protein
VGTDPLVTSAEALRTLRQNKHNPLPYLKPDMLARVLDQFEHGYLRDACLLWEKIAERDDVIASVKPKREKDVSQLDMQVVVAADSGADGDAHKDVLERFWKNVRCVNSYDRNERGGFRRLVKQMMTAVSYRYAAHHIIWQPRPDGELRATFEFVPLWQFENRTGRLRYLPSLSATGGEILADGEWMVTTGDGLMISCCIGYLAKRSAFNDWLVFSEKFSVPGVMGRTTAKKGSAEAEAMKAAVESFGHDWMAVIYGDDGTHAKPIELVQANGNPAGMPMPAVVERVDRKFAALYRGADLSSMSSNQGDGTGASLQEKETDILRRDDAETIAETLEEVSRMVIEWHFGNGVEPLARVELVVPVQEDTSKVIDAGLKLAEAGARVSKSALMERANIPEAKDEEDVLGAVKAETLKTETLKAETRKEDLENAAVSEDFAERLTAALSSDLQPLGKALAGALQAGDGAAFQAALKKISKDMPEFLESAAMEDLLADEMVRAFLGEGEEVENANGMWRTLQNGRRIWIDLAYDPEVQLQRGEAAVEQALKGQDVWDAMELEPEIGTVSFISPKAGTAAKGYHDGGGLLHLVNARKAEGEDGERTARMMPRVLAYGRRSPAYGPANGRRMNITHKKHTAVLSLYLEGNRRTWLLTGFKDNPTK